MRVERPKLLFNPHDDPALRRAAEGLLDEGIHSIPDFVRRLRSAYPKLMVSRRDLTGERDPVWYVYREGHWVSDRSRPA
ncbi:MAG TPA: hypothetical protein VKR24_01000 [Candidatus Limnocylindrales bacterium]|nr:hypothetical protein [Candidatus Limnocylindrales bacterium]